MVNNPYPDPVRTVRVDGPLSKATARQIIAEINLLVAKSAKPVTVYLKSRGGDIKAFYELERRFRFRGAGKGRSIVITIAGEASSAAAYLLVLGHFAYLEENAFLGFHGVGGPNPNKRRMFRREHAQAIALRLDRENRKIAKRLAKRVARRLTAKVVYIMQKNNLRPRRNWLWQFFNEVADGLRPQLSSETSVKLLYESLDRFKLMVSLARYFPATKPLGRRTNLASVEAAMFKALIAYEVNAHPSPHWAINPTVSAELMLDYLLARDFIRGQHYGYVNGLSRRFGKSFLTKVQTGKYNRLLVDNPINAERFLVAAARPCSMSLWCFTLIFCHRLLSGENHVPARDAYWLGLVDEVLEPGQSKGNTLDS